MENSITRWDYQKSVEKVKTLTYKWKNLTVDIVREIYQAREALDARGHNQGKEKVTNVTFSQYLEDCSLEYRTVHRWLERYLPKEDRLLSHEEHQERKLVAHRQKVDHAEALRSKVIQRIKTKKTPADWNDEAEQAYQQQLADDAADRERIRQWKEAQEKLKAAPEHEAPTADPLLDTAAVDQLRKRSEFKARIKLSSTGTTAPFFDAIMDYLDGLENDDRRIEACNDLVKLGRTIAVQLHQKKHRSA